MGGHKIDAGEEPGEFENELGEVRPCECGGVQLCMGPMTLHFAAKDVDRLLELAGAARELVEDQRRRKDAQRRSTGKDAQRRSTKTKAHGTLH